MNPKQQIFDAFEFKPTAKIPTTVFGGGVWTIEIEDGTCRVREGFASRADVRYTASARDWCEMALGLTSDRDAVRSGQLKKDGEGGSLAWYFHQPKLDCVKEKS